MTRWPDAVWRSPWLRGIDDVARAAIEAAGRVRTLEKGARVFAVGEPADAFFVVGEGLVDVRAVRRGETEARAIRRAVAGDALGEDAIVRAGAARAAEATCATRVVVAEVPVAVFRRAAARAGEGQAGTLEGALRRAAGRDVLRTSSLGHALSDGDVEALLASSEARALARGEVLFAAGDPATHAYVVADGMVQVRDEAGGKLRVRAYLSRGDLVADGALESGGTHDVTVAACGPAWVLAIPRAELLRVVRRARGVLDRARRLASSTPVDAATRHVLGDLWRFAVAGSMLVIDDEACVRCGHCAASCADAHGDGVSRLVRRGEKVAVRDAVDGSSRALIVPGSCQHCKHPACMIDCPTGAIGRDPHGSVFVREDLCVGCGRCATACPWGSVHMAPRPAKTGKHLPVVLSADVAVKCDLCSDVPSGPACVSACPVDAIGRIEPVAAIAEVRRAVAARAPRQALPRVRAAWPWVTGAVPIAAALGRLPSGAGSPRMLTGVLSGAMVVALVAYSAIKRRGARGENRQDARAQGGEANEPGVLASWRASLAGLRPHAIVHMALGVLAAGMVACARGGRMSRRTPRVRSSSRLPWPARPGSRGRSSTVSRRRPSRASSGARSCRRTSRRGAAISTTARSAR